MKTLKKSLGIVALAAALYLAPQQAKAVDSNAIFQVTSPTNLTWNWQTQWKFSPTNVAGGNVSGDPDGWYDESNSVHAVATPSNGFYFNGWKPGTVPANMVNSNDATWAITNAWAPEPQYGEKYFVTVNQNPTTHTNAVPGSQYYMPNEWGTQSIASVVADTNNPTEKRYRITGYTLSP